MPLRCISKLVEAHKDDDPYSCVMINDSGRIIVFRIVGLETRLACGGFYEKYSAPGS